MAAAAPALASSAGAESAARGDFYLRYSVGHEGKFGRELLQFEYCPDGLLRYVNQSGYKHDGLIRREVHVGATVLEEVRRLIEQSGILREDDARWPEPSRGGRQELEVVLGDKHLFLLTSDIGSVLDVEKTGDPEGLKVFWLLARDLRELTISLINIHFKVKPI